MLAAEAVDLTIITHGFSFDGQFSAWVEDMGRAINDRAGYGCSPQQIAASRMEHSAPAAAPEQGCANLILFDWSEVSGLGFSGNADSDQVAGALASFVRARLSEDLPTNLHFLGHSRGAFVVRAAIGRLTGEDLARVGWLQMTTFDPQNFGNDGVLDVSGVVDLADNYLQRSSAGLGGNVVPGAVNVDLTAVLEAWPGRADRFAEHSEVHDWYHWTIDLQTYEPEASNPNADVALATQAVRETLFPNPAWELGANTGYRGSVGGGGAEAWLAMPWTNHLLPTDVDLSGATTAADALAIIQEINRANARELPVPRPSGGGNSPRIDSSGDNRVSALDVILVVNELNRAATWAVGGEGESDFDFLSSLPEQSSSPAAPLAAMPARTESFAKVSNSLQQPDEDFGIFSDPTEIVAQVEFDIEPEGGCRACR